MKQSIAALPIGLLISSILACNAPVGTRNTPVVPSPTTTMVAQMSTIETPEPTVETTTVPATETPFLTVAVPASVTPALTYGTPIYETTFRTGWPDLTSNNPSGAVVGRSLVVDGGYQFEVGKDWAHWARTTRVSASSLYVEVMAMPITCPAGQGGYGLMLHYVNNNQYRYFVITCNGSYLLLERNLPETTILASGRLPESINPTTGSHTIGVQAIDNTLSAFVDGIWVATATVTDMPAGDIGAYVEADLDVITVVFSHLAAYETE